MELRHKKEGLLKTGLFSLNRTYVELRLHGLIINVSAYSALNRTYVELRLRRPARLLIPKYPLNRTYVELRLFLQIPSLS